MMLPLYIRDLDKMLQIECKAEIRNGSDEKLKQALINDEDIQVGRVYYYKKMRIA